MAGGKMIKAAKILGYSRVTLWKKLKQLNIDRAGI
jgi:transcriptional regulator of acetoin/glycerol metabolism